MYRKSIRGFTYFLFLLQLLEPPVESNIDASRVAGFLEARKAEIRRYFADVDIWNSKSSKSGESPNLRALPLRLAFSLLTSPLEEGLEEILNASFREGMICG